VLGKDWVRAETTGEAKAGKRLSEGQMAGKGLGMG